MTINTQISANYVSVKHSIPTATFIFLATTTFATNIHSQPDEPMPDYLDKATASYYASPVQTKLDNSIDTQHLHKNIETLHQFASGLIENIEDLDPEFSKAINEEFWNLI